MNDHDKALECFMEAIADSNKLMAEIQAHLDDHMGANPEAVNWGNVGLAEWLRYHLIEIGNFLFKRED
jgi:hypothetical protein